MESDSETNRSLAASVASAHEIDEDYTPTERVTRATRCSSKLGLLPNYHIPHYPPRKTPEASTSRTPAISSPAQGSQPTSAKSSREIRTAIHPSASMTFTTTRKMTKSTTRAVTPDIPSMQVDEPSELREPIVGDESAAEVVDPSQVEQSSSTSIVVVPDLAYDLDKAYEEFEGLYHEGIDLPFLDKAMQPRKSIKSISRIAAIVTMIMDRNVAQHNSIFSAYWDKQLSITQPYIKYYDQVMGAAQVRKCGDVTNRTLRQFIQDTLGVRMIIKVPPQLLTFIR